MSISQLGTKTSINSQAATRNVRWKIVGGFLQYVDVFLWQFEQNRTYYHLVAFYFSMQANKPDFIINKLLLSKL